MTKAAVFYHFPAKEDLLVVVLGPAMTRVGHVLEKHGQVNGVQERRELVTDLVAVVAEVGPQVVMMLSDPAAGSHVRALTGEAAMPSRVGRALLGRESADPKIAARGSHSGGMCRREPPCRCGRLASRAPERGASRCGQQGRTR